MTFATLTPTVDIEPDDGRQVRWQDHANCLGADPDLFFPTTGKPNGVAKALCSACVVRSSCLEFGMNEEHGIFGGVSARERKRMRRRERRQRTNTVGGALDLEARPAPVPVAVTPNGERWHGTVNGYNNYGCRCPACREANAVMLRTRREKRS